MKDVYISFSPWTITKKHEVYTRTASGRSWKARPDETTVETVSRDHYLNYANSISFWNGFLNGTCRGYCGYTAAGYIPVKIVSINPDRTRKHVVYFTFKG